MNRCNICGKLTDEPELFGEVLCRDCSSKFKYKEIFKKQSDFP